MPAALSVDLRQRIMRAYNSGKPVREIAEQYYVGQDAVYKLAKRVKETGSVEPKPLNNGRKSKLSPAQLDAIRDRVTQYPYITLEKLIDELELPVGKSALSKIINYKLKIRRKKSEILLHR